MYRYDDFKDNIDLKYFADTILLAKEKFKNGNIIKREDLIGYGDSWMNMACIDKLHELNYIAVVEYHEISNFTTYRNIRL